MSLAPPLPPFDLANAYAKSYAASTHLIFDGDRLVAQTTSWDARNAALRLLYGNGKGEHVLVLPPNVRTDAVGSAG
jgi:hypothetical protein